MADITAAKPFYSVLILAFVCSALVAAAAVGLRPMQDANRALDQKKNILYAAGLYNEQKSVDEMFSAITPKLVNLKTGDYVPESQITVQGYDQIRASLDPNNSKALSNEQDTAKLRRLENISLVYLVEKDNSLSQIILPVRGKGLWSTMFAYVALNADLNTISGVSFYQHGETPGLGGEIENKIWQHGWVGKKVYDPDGNINVTVIKGKADPTNADAAYQIDGISGATLTSNGVGDLLEFWFGDNGFKPYFSRLEKERAHG